MTPVPAEAVRNTKNAAVRSKLPRLLAIKIVKAAGNQASSEPHCLQLCFCPQDQTGKAKVEGKYMQRVQERMMIF